MPHRDVERLYRAESAPSLLRERLADALTVRGFILRERNGDSDRFRNPSLTFSSTKPLTCISSLQLSVQPSGGGSEVRAVFTFTKIKVFIITVLIMVCLAIPSAIGIAQRGYPDIPPTAWICIPVGFLVHYHVRARAIRAFGRLVSECGGR